MPLYGGIEAGGTKFVCAIGTGPLDIRAETRFPTATPTEAIGKAIAFFRDYQGDEPLTAIGVASFGPVDPDPDLEGARFTVRVGRHRFPFHDDPTVGAITQDID